MNAIKIADYMPWALWPLHIAPQPNFDESVVIQ